MCTIKYSCLSQSFRCLTLLVETIPKFSTALDFTFQELFTTSCLPVRHSLVLVNTFVACSVHVQFFCDGLPRLAHTKR